MAETTYGRAIRAGFFDTVPQADQAVRELLAAGFSRDELALIVPEKFQEEFAPDVPRAHHPGSHPGTDIAEGGAIGAALGGIALAATAIATGGVGLLPAIPVLLGGGALAGGFSGYYLSDGYGKGVGEYYEDAIHLGKIVVGVHLEGDDIERRLTDAEHILNHAGANPPVTNPR